MAGSNETFQSVNIVASGVGRATACQSHRVEKRQSGDLMQLPVEFQRGSPLNLVESSTHDQSKIQQKDTGGGGAGINSGS